MLLHTFDSCKNKQNTKTKMNNIKAQQKKLSDEPNWRILDQKVVKHAKRYILTKLTSS